MTVDSLVRNDLDIEAWVEEMIAENGYAQLSVHEPSSGRPGFAYTVGLEASRQVPEMFCMGVSPDIASQLFSICIEGHDEGRIDLALGNQDTNRLLAGHTFRFRFVSSAILLGATDARPIHAEDIKTVLQILLPDNAGNFPGDDGCDAEISTAQDPDRLMTPRTI